MKDSKKIRMNIKNMEDINKLKNNPNIKYLNINLTTPDLEVIYYLIEHGQKYSYSDLIEEQPGYIYVPHKIFKKSQMFILDIINHIPKNLNQLEIARYLYITIGKNLGYDINILPEKNETFSLKNINIINNLWGSIQESKGTNISFCKLYLYLCQLMNIDCQIITTSQTGYLKNILTIDNNNIIVDITQDIPYIQAGFKTRNFNGYNDTLEIDKKIFYIKEDYNEIIIDKKLKYIPNNQKQIFKNILSITQDIIKVQNIKPIELGLIYDLIFTKYCPNYNISINNLYIKNKTLKEHFILITNEQQHYSYNYTKNSFVEIPKEELIKSFESKRVGIYLNEKIPTILNKEKQESY